MNKRITSVLIVFTVLLAIIGSASAAQITLVSKDRTSWTEIPSNGNALLTYNPSGPTFNYNVSGTVPLANTPYSLIYYMDQPDRFNSSNWGRIGAIIGNTSSDNNKNINMEGSADIGSIPYSNDVNVANGAKIWVVPTSNVNVVQMSMVPGGWNPENYLFERTLIKYTKMDVTSGIVTTANTVVDVQPSQPAKNIEIDFNTVSFGTPTAGSNSSVSGDTDLTTEYNPTIKTTGIVSITVTGADLVSQSTPPVTSISKSALSVNLTGIAGGGNLENSQILSGLVSGTPYAMNFQLAIPGTASGQYKGTISVGETV